MSKLDELIAELCPNGVKFRSIRECVQEVEAIKWRYEGDHNYKYIDLTSVDRDTHQIAETQIICADNAPSRAQQIVKSGDILFGTTRPMLKRYCLVNKEYDGQICSTGFCVLRAKNSIVLPGWLYYLIASSAFFSHVEKFQKGASYPAISDGDVKRYRIPVPPLPVQAEIVRILDNFTEVTAQLNEQLSAELVARKKQYEYFSSGLLGGGFGNTKKYEIIPLGEIARFTYGFTDKAKGTGNARFIRITDIDDNGCLKQDGAKYIDLTEASKKYLLKKGDLLMARTGATYGKTLSILDDTPAVYASFLIKIILDNSKMLNRFYWHFAQTNLYWQQAEKLVSTGGQPQFNTGAISRVLVPVPSLEDQACIVAALDRFSDLCKDLNSSLPAEIEARQKQYEYYRDKLLAFQGQ